MDRNAFFRRIPKIDNILEEEQILSFIQDYGLSYVTDCVRIEVENLRRCIREEEEERRIEQAFSSLYSRITERIEGDVKPKLRKVINATGTILHTNLGRALLSRGKIPDSRCLCRLRSGNAGSRNHQQNPLPGLCRSGQ
mgnify:CR=1 FL=1